MEQDSVRQSKAGQNEARKLVEWSQIINTASHQEAKGEEEEEEGR